MSRSKLSPALLFLGTLLLPLPVLAAPGEKVQCVGIEIESGSAVTRGGAVPQFSATQVVDLTLRAHTSRNLTGNHVLQFRVFTPGHRLYQALDVPVVDPSVSAGTRKLPGYPFAVREKKPVSASSNGVASYALEASLPVGGTAIVARGLYGLWSVDASWDGVPLCGAQGFRITP